MYEEISKAWCYVHSVVSLTWKWNFHVCYIGETKDTTLMPNAVRQVCFYQTHLCVRNLMWSNSGAQKGAGREGTWEASFGRVEFQF